MSNRYEVSLGSEKKEIIKKRNIGYLVEQYGKKFNTKNCHLSIENEVFHGNFIIPLAVGYSTTLASLGDISKAKLIFTTNRVHGANNINSESLFENWRKIYSVDVCKKRKNRTVTNSSDNMECVMCLDDYKVGEKLHVFDCKHRIHEHCYPKNKKIPCPHCREEESE